MSIANKNIKNATVDIKFVFEQKPKYSVKFNLNTLVIVVNLPVVEIAVKVNNAINENNKTTDSCNICLAKTLPCSVPNAKIVIIAKTSDNIKNCVICNKSELLSIIWKNEKKGIDAQTGNSADKAKIGDQITMATEDVLGKITLV